MSDTRPAPAHGAPRGIRAPTGPWRPRDGFGWPTADLVLSLIAEGASLRWIGRHPGYPSPGTFQLWLRADPEDDTGCHLSTHYARARELQADSLAHYAVECADKAADPQMGRLRYDAYRWYAGKMSGRYADRGKVDLELGEKTRDALERSARATLESKLEDMATRMDSSNGDGLADAEPEE
ncbi:MAG: hypothetical protein V3S43_03510 [Acidimicrobiia bacterium]